MHARRSTKPLGFARASMAARAILCGLMLFAVGSAVVSAKPEHELGPAFLVRPDGPNGPLAGYDATTGEERFTWPAGLLAADGSRYYSSSSTGDETSIDVYDPRIPSSIESFILDGAWELRGVSATGKWLALRRIPTDAELAGWKAGEPWQTEIAVMDATTSRIAHVLRLDGNFDVDAVSAGGNSLFLVQHQPAIDTEHYLIRLYDLASNTLQEGALRDKTNTDEVMTGYAWEGVGSADGQWLLTLYLNTKRDNAFVHSLDLVNQYPVCITLPSGTGDMAKLKAYSLVMAPSGWYAYAVNPALGRVAMIDLTDRQIAHVAAFQPVNAATDGDRPATRVLLSPDGKMLYFTGGQIVWAYDTASGRIVHSYAAPAEVDGLGLSPDGERVLVVGKGSGVTAIDTVTGTLAALAGA
jgi:hypothetical protein